MIPARAGLVYPTTGLVSFMAIAVSVGLRDAWAGVLVLALSSGIILGMLNTPVMLAVLAASIPMQSIVTLDVAGRSLTATQICVLSLLTGWGITCRGARVPLDGLAWAYAAVSLTLGVSLVTSADVPGWMSAMYQWTICLVVFLIARTELETIQDVLAIVFGTALGVALVSAYALVQVITRDGPPSFVVNGVVRAYGTFGEPNPLAIYLELTLPLMLATAVFSLIRPESPILAGPHLWAMVGASALGTIVLALTQSRGGLLGFGCALTVIVMAMPPRFRAICSGMLAVSLVGIAFSPARDLVFGRFALLIDRPGGRTDVTARTWAADERRAHWGAAWNMLVSHPWTGIGAGDFSDEFRRYTPEWRFRISRGHAHNGYLQLGAMAGTPGLTSFVVWTLTGLVSVVRAITSPRDPHCRDIAVGCLAVVVAFIVHSMVDYLNVLSLGLQLALILAIGLWCMRPVSSARSAVVSEPMQVSTS